MRNLFLILITLLLASCQSEYFSVSPSSQVNSTPGSFSLTTVERGNAKVTLSWTPSALAESYTVRYGTSSGDYSTFESTNASNPFEITNLTHGVEYYFMVTAETSQGTIDSDNELSAEAIFLDDFTLLNLGSIWQLGSNPASYSSVFNPDPAIIVSSDGNDLIFNEGPNRSVNQQFETRENFDLTDSWVSTDFSGAPTDDGERYREAGLWIINSAADGFEMFVANGALACGTYYSNGNMDVTSTVLYDPVLHKHIRIRHETSDDSIRFEASPDEVTWTSIRTMLRAAIVPAIPIHQLHFILYVFNDHNGFGDAGIPLAKFGDIKSNAPFTPQ